MTSGRRAKQHRRANGVQRHLSPPSDDDTTAMQLGWAFDDGQLDEVAHKATSMLVRMMGDRRTSDVAVHELRGPDAHELLAESVRREHASGRSDPDRLNLYRRLRGLLREHPESIIVLVTATGRRP